jgi:hypothetical protein
MKSQLHLKRRRHPELQRGDEPRTPTTTSGRRAFSRTRTASPRGQRDVGRLIVNIDLTDADGHPLPAVKNHRLTPAPSAQTDRTAGLPKP